MKNNILILSAGRRVELLKAFKDMLSSMIPEGKVFATDLHPHLSAACQASHFSFVAPRVTSIEYVPFLINLCVEKNIGLVIPTIDTELIVLSEYRKEFERIGVNLIISDLELVKVCRDKNLTGKLFNDIDIPYPVVYDRDNIQFPCFMKPYDGSCSIGAQTLLTNDALKREHLDNEKNMFMELIPSTYKEYTVDAYYSKDGILKCYVPRERIEVRSGEVSKGITRKNSVYNFLKDKISNIKGARGCLTIQIFVSEDLKDIKGLEVNPRFGGGYPLSFCARANFPAMLINEYLLGNTLSFFEDWEDSLLMLRYDASIVVSSDDI